MTWEETGFFVLGLVLLAGGAEFFVRGASRLAKLAGLSPLVVGLTVVAFGTSAPEVAVSVASAFKGQSDMSVGNVVGSNLFNLLFILGAAALIVPLVVSGQLVRLDVPVMIGSAILMYVLALDYEFERWNGVLLLAVAAIYTFGLIRMSRAKRGDAAEQTEGAPLGGAKGWALSLTAILGGLVALVVGSNWLVDAAVAMATAWGVSELVIGLTIVAAGTSLPEVATSLAAAARGQRDIAVGNVVGSSIFNVLVVLGIASTVAPSGLAVSKAALSLDIPIMLAVMLICWPILATGGIIERWEGFLFFAYYCAYTTYIILDATQHEGLSLFNRVMVAFVIPVTGIALLVLWIRWFRRHQRKGKLPANR